MEAHRGVAGGRIHQQAQRRHHIGHVRLKEQPAETDDLAGNALAAQRLLEEEELRTSTDQDGDLRPRDAGSAAAGDLVRHPGGLVVDSVVDCAHHRTGILAVGGGAQRTFVDATDRMSAASAFAASRMRWLLRKLTVSPVDDDVPSREGNRGESRWESFEIAALAPRQP